MRFLFTFLVCLNLVALYGRDVQQDRDRHNVLLIIGDDMRPDMGAYGNPVVVTPTIDSIARNGMVFNRAYCQMSLCSPSRASMMTGLRPDIIQVYDLTTHFRDAQPTVVTLPQMFKDNGYHALALHKVYHNGIEDPLSWSIPWWRPGAPTWLDSSNIVIQQTHPKGRPWESVDVPDNKYRDGKLGDKVLEVLDNLPDDRPFFMAVGFEKPHLPYNPPRKYWDLYREEDIALTDNSSPPFGMPPYAGSGYGELLSYYGVPSEGQISETLARTLVHGYYASISFVDAQIARIIQKLRETGELENTIVVIMGDHGYKLGEYGMWSKATNYEIDTRVPLIISTPETKGRALTTDAIVELLDLYPTLAEMTGQTPPPEIQGKSLVPLFEDPRTEIKAAAYSQYPRLEGEAMGYTVRTENFRYVLWQNTSTLSIMDEELYDHRYDPGERINIAGLSGYVEALVAHRKLIETQTTIGFETDVYPNPVQRDFIVVTVEGGPENSAYEFSFVLYDGAGKKLMEKGGLEPGTNIIYLNHITSAAAIYQIINAGNVISQGRLILE